jgi:FtsP/CotA-like multicopper oxidase with cupredoxin domain
MIFSVVLVLFVFTCAASLVQASNGQGNLPAAVDINPDPKIFETNFVAMEAQVDLGNGLLANANTFNGAIPGPELRLKVGDRVIVHFTNRLPVPSSIQWYRRHAGSSASRGDLHVQIRRPQAGRLLVSLAYHAHEP